MAITLVDVGTTANDGTGDPLRTAFQTVNTALTRLDNTVNVQTGYVLLKDDSGSSGVVVTTAGNVGFGTTSPQAAAHVAGGELWVGSDGVLDGKIVLRDSGAVTNEPEIYTNSTADLIFKAWAGASAIRFITGSSAIERVVIAPNGFVGFGSGLTPTAVIDVDSDVIRLRTAKTPASAAASGNAGDICWDANYIYVCTATNTWKRAALATW